MREENPMILTPDYKKMKQNPDMIPEKYVRIFAF